MEGIRLKFRATVKDINPKFHLLIKWAEMEPDEISGDRIGELHEEDGTIGTTMLHNRLIGPLEGAAVDDAPDCGGRERPGGVAKTHEQVQPHDADAWAPNHVEGHDAAQDRETAGCPRHGEQMGGPGARVGAGQQGEHLGHDEDRHLDSHDARGAPGQHPPTRRQDQRVQAGQREGGESC